jgi:tellurite resistance protein TehA-like permease
MELSSSSNPESGRYRDTGKEYDSRATSLQVGGDEPLVVNFKERLKHFTFAWYASSMSTGGVAFVLSVVPNRFNGLTGLGTGVFVFNLIYFIIITIIICLRFTTYPGTFTKAFTNPHEGLFFSTFLLTLATIITNTTAYGVPNSGSWINPALRVAFWIYTVVTTLFAISYYHLLFTVKKLVISEILANDESIYVLTHRVI